MAKPTLFYTVREKWLGYEVMRVTSIGRSTYHGANEHREPTHCRQGDTHGRFDTIDQARALIARIRAIDDAHGVVIKQAERSLNDARNARRRAIAELLNPERKAA